MSGVSKILRSVHFVEARTGWVVGDAGTILRTADGGSTWTKVNSVLLEYRDVYFVEAMTGWMVGYDPNNAY